MVKKKTSNILPRIRKILLKLIMMIFCFTVLQVLALKLINPPLTPNVAWEWAESVIEGKPEKQPRYLWKKMERISPHLRRAVLAAEDQRFLKHNGFDYNEIWNAVKGLARGEKLRGASTISMQTARSVFLLSSRSIARKAAEIYYTVLIEMLWSKHRILEMYLNTVDWGTGVTGAEAAAQKYFSKSAGSLNPEEAALMTAVLPNPHIWSVRNASDYIKMRQKRILSDLALMPLL